MAASTFDTLAAADRLRDAGFDDAQSPAIVGGFIAIATALRLL